MKNIGMEYPINDNDVMRLSVKEYCFIAATSPRIKEMIIMKTSAVVIKIKVIGRRCLIILRTGWCEKKEEPKLPCKARPSHLTYCTGTGWSRPKLCRNASRSAWVIPCLVAYRSEERRVGKECRSRWAAAQEI